MKLFTAFLKLIRWPNLGFIVLTQALFYYCIIVPVFGRQKFSHPDGSAVFFAPVLSPFLFWLLVAASVLIAAAGYVINDYFDLHIDAVNKPGKLVIDKSIKRRWAIVWHLILSVAGILISIEVTYKIHELYSIVVLVINILSVLALWLYSTTYKRRLLVGNVLISLLTAWTIMILYLINLRDWFADKVDPQYYSAYETACTRMFKFAILYASFAFVISLIREVVKDMEDIEGDAKYNCKTMPIVWGVPAAKVFTAVWIVVLIAVLVIVQFYAIQLGWWWSAVYCILLVIVPLLWVLRKLYTAQVPQDYHRLSSVIKLIMLAGILSMLFIKWYG